MKKYASFLLCVIWLAFRYPSSVAAEPLGWKPSRTWVFAVGVLKFKNKEAFGSFPSENRRDTTLVQFFQARGVPGSHMVFLKDKQATQHNIVSSFNAFIKKPRAGDFVLIYFTGHGYEAEDGKDGVYLTSYDAGDKGRPGWFVGSIPPTIARGRAARALLFLDCCLSGSATQLAKRYRGKTALATLTSATAEAESTGNWTFTDALIDALRGKPFVDLNRDGAISLGELARHAENDMRLAEKQRSTFYAPPRFGPDTVLARATRAASTRVGQRVSVRSEGDWYVSRIIDVRGDESLVHYIGYDDEYDEWVSKSRIVPVRMAQYPVGAKVQVKDEGDWYAARILKVKGDKRYVHYDDYDEDEDEWVVLNRIRPAK